MLLQATFKMTVIEISIITAPPRSGGAIPTVPPEPPVTMIIFGEYCLDPKAGFQMLTSLHIDDTTVQQIGIYA